MKKTSAKKSAFKKGLGLKRDDSGAVIKKTEAKPMALSSAQPDLLKRDLVRQTIITVLWRKEEVTLPILMTELKKEIGHHFDGDIDQYVDIVVRDLLGWKLMEETPGRKPIHYRLSQKLDKKDDED